MERYYMEHLEWKSPDYVVRDRERFEEYGDDNLCVARYDTKAEAEAEAARRNGVREQEVERLIASSSMSLEELGSLYHLEDFDDDYSPREKLAFISEHHLEPLLTDIKLAIRGHTKWPVTLSRYGKENAEDEVIPLSLVIDIGWDEQRFATEGEWSLAREDYLLHGHDAQDDEIRLRHPLVDKRAEAAVRAAQDLIIQTGRDDLIEVGLYY